MSDPRAHAVALLLSLLAPACGANKNHAQRERAAAEAEAEAEALDAGRPDGCIRSCLPDPGSLPVDCAKAEEGIEFGDLFLRPPPLPARSAAIWNFEDLGQRYSYHDGSALDPTGDPEPVDRCGENGNNALHVRGGPYAGWGGGVGTSIKDWWTRLKDDPRDTNPNPPDCVAPGTPFPCEDQALNSNIHGRFVDASAWDGISLWMRRGPEGQDGVRVTLGDKYTDDEQNIDQDQGMPNSDGVDTEQQYCKRAKTCSCPSNRPCTEFPDPGSARGVTNLCYDPRYDSLPVKGTDGKFSFSGFPGRAPVHSCAQSACDEDFAAGGKDYAFLGKACTPFQLQTGENASYCFNPADAPPPENYERCGDHWQTPIRLSTDWQLFLVPFSDMRQQGYGKESQKLLIDQLSLFRLTWEGGYVDFYVDDVRFYRVRR